MHAYFKNRYVAPNITAVAAGNFDWPSFASLVEKHCDSWQKAAAGREGVTAANGAGKFHVDTKADVTQEHVILMSSGPPAESAMPYAADTLALAIGDDTGSRLYWSLVDRGRADSADCSFHDYQGTGSFFTSFSCLPAKTQQNLETVMKVLETVQA